MGGGGPHVFDHVVKLWILSVIFATSDVLEIHACINLTFN